MAQASAARSAEPDAEGSAARRHPPALPFSPPSTSEQVRAQEDELRGQLAEMRAKQAETGTDIPALVQERDECR